MKKSIIFIVVLLSFSLCSCDFSDGITFSNDDHEKCDKIITDLTSYLKSKDFEKAKSLFAPILYKMESFESDLNSLINYYEGDFIGLTGLVHTGEHSDFDYSEKHHLIDDYHIETTADMYRCVAFYVEYDSRSNENVGITRLYILKISEDPYPDREYGGSLNNSTKGIFVAYPHELPEKD